MSRYLTAILLVFITMLSVPAVGAEIAEVSVLEIHPTQPAAGYAASEATQLFKYKNIRDDAALRARVLQEKPLRAVIGPGGEFFLTDGHHRALGVYRTAAAICENTRPAADVAPCIRSIKVKVQVDGNYTGQSWNTFVDQLMKENNLYLPKPVKEAVVKGTLPKEKLLKQPGGILPESLAKLANDPMRSAIGTLFYYQGVSGDNFANYLEFLVAERLNGVVPVQVGHEFEPGVQVRLMKAIFGNGDIVTYIRCLARRDETAWKTAQQQINQVVGIDTDAPFAPSHCGTEK